MSGSAVCPGPVPKGAVQAWHGAESLRQGLCLLAHPHGNGQLMLHGPSGIITTATLEQNGRIRSTWPSKPVWSGVV